MVNKSSLFDYYKNRVRCNKCNVTDFMNKVIQVSKNLDIDPLWLLAVMDSESHLDSTAQNTAHPVGGGFATGLIQFIPSSAGMVYYGKNYDVKKDAAAGYPQGRGATEKLKNMSSIEQLDYVEKYFKSYIKNLNSYVDLYMVTFFPVAVGKPDDFVLEAKYIPRAKIATSNPVFDLNKDKKITVGEVKEAFLKRIPTQYQSEFIKGGGDIIATSITRYSKRNWIPLSLAFIGIATIATVFIKYRNKI